MLKIGIKHINSKFLIAFLALNLALLNAGQAHAQILFQNALFEAEGDTWIIDTDATTTTPTLQFGGSLNQTIAYNNASTRFEISNNVQVTGSVTSTAGASLSGGTTNINASSNNATNINTGTSNGAVSIGGGSGTVAIDSSSWDISSAGVASGLTGITSTGTVNFSGAGAFRMREAADHTTANCATIGELLLNTTTNVIYACTATGTPGTWTSTAAAGSTPDFEAVYTQDADKTITTTNGAIPSAAGSGAISANSTNASGITLNGSVNGAVNIATGTSTGTVTLGGTGTQTIAVGNGAGNKTVNIGSSNTTSTTTLLSGSGTLSLNASNNQATNINTGTSTGTVTVGGSAAQTIDIGTGAAAKTVSLGSTNTTSTTTVNSGSGGVLVNASNSQPTFINTGTSTGAVNVATGASTQTISIASGAGAKTTTLGSTNTTSTTTINSGSGGVNVNANNNQPTNINTGTSTGAVSIGGNSNTVAVDATNWDITTAGAITSGANGQDGKLTFYSEQGATDFSVVFDPNAAMTQNVTYTLPADDGTAGQVMVTNGTGGLSWGSPYSDGLTGFLVTRHKTAAQTNNTTTLASDTHLQFSMAASEVWVARYTLNVTSAGNRDIQVGWTLPAGATCTGLYSYRNSPSTGTGIITNCTTATPITIGNSSTGKVIDLDIVVTNSTTAGQTTFQWAASGGINGITLETGSVLKANKEN